MAKYAQNWIDEYAKKNIKYRYWYYNDKFVSLLEPLDADIDFSFADLSVITGKSVSELKSILDEE